MKRNRRFVGVAQCAVGGPDDVLASLGLGSCVAIALHDPVARVGGLAHVLLPRPARPSEGSAAPMRFATTAVPRLIEAMERHGAVRTRMVARLVGGAAMFGHSAASGKPGIGARNVEAAREALDLAGIPLVGQETGEDHGRSVHFEVGTGRVLVTAARRARAAL